MSKITSWEIRYGEAAFADCSKFYLFIYLAIGKVRSIILVNLQRLAAIQVLVEVIALATWGEFSHIPLSINDANNVPAR